MQEKVIDKILQSQAMKGHETYRKLLKYIFEHYKNDTIPTELSIAIDVFNRTADFDPSTDSLVRVYMHKLRQKLEHYYLTEGKSDSIVVSIPRGHYKLVFSNKYQTNGKFKKKRTRYFLIGSAVLLPLILLLVFFLSPGQNEQRIYPKLAQSVFWSDVLSSEKPLMIVLGDYYFYGTYNEKTGDELLIRHFNINSPQEFDRYQAKGNYSGELHRINYTYLGHFTPYVLNDLLPFVHQQTGQVEIALMSRFNPQHINKYNIIFLGLYKTMGLFKSYFNHSDIDIQIYDGELVVPKNRSEISTKMSIKGRADSLHNDFGTIARLPGPKNNTILLILSFADAGIMECTNIIMDINKLNEAYERIENNDTLQSNYFEMLYQIQGMDRYNFDSELLFVNGLDKNLNIWKIQK